MSDQSIKSSDIGFDELWQVVVPKDLGRFVKPEALSERLTHSSLSKRQGLSEEGRPIHSWQWGEGPVRIAAWSQMHGNESTGTRALELLRILLEENLSVDICKLRGVFSFVALPMLNPDGAHLWTRRNALGIDINRDALAQQSAEARTLAQFLQEFDPHLCLNLHDQRSTFQRGDSGLASELSIAVPQYAHPEAKSISGRDKAVQWVERSFTFVNNDLIQRMSRFDERYYPRSFGEWAQNRGMGAVLLESGVGGRDFERNSSLKLLFEWILGMLLSAEESVNSPDIELTKGTQRLSLPENNEGLLDRIDRSAQIRFTQHSFVTDLGWRLVEKRSENGLSLEWELEDIGDLSSAFAREVHENTHFQVLNGERLEPGLKRPYHRVP